MEQQLSIVIEDDENDKKLKEAILRPNFADLASDIMRNTMYNLLQEAAFEEFPIAQEPLSFAIKDKQKN